MRILAIEPYYGGSHRAFLDGLVAESEHEFVLLTMPPRKWKWRMRGAAIRTVEQIEDNPPGEAGGIDVIFTCDMLSVADLRALLPRALRDVPIVCYFHENQLTYPIPDAQDRDFQYGFTNLTSALAADAVWFNSDYHRREFLTAAESLLRKMPDCLPSRAIERVERKAEVLHPGIDLPTSPLKSTHGDSPVILWNQRWEFDKNPDAIFTSLFELRGRGAGGDMVGGFRLIVCGERFRTVPTVFAEAREKLAEEIEHWGFAANRSEYHALLSRADIVVSTAIHEFFGLSVMEAVAAGARPLLPRRLSYPELFDPVRWPEIFYESDDELTDRLADVLTHPTMPPGLSDRAASFAWAKRARVFDAALSAVVESVESVEPVESGGGGRV